MSSERIIFSVSKHGHNLGKNIKKDSNGYYYVCLGALNYHNSTKAVYLSDGINDLMNSNNSDIKRRLESGYLYGELGHPKKTPGQTSLEYMSRFVRIDDKSVSHHIKGVEFENTDINIGNGLNNVVKIMGWVKPTGPYGKVLEENLNNPDCNTAFSIRVLTVDRIQNNMELRKIVQIVTWDAVIEPGIDIANKFDTIASGHAEGLDFDIDFVKIEDLVNQNSNKTILRPEVACNFEDNTLDILNTVLHNKELSINTTSNRFKKW